MTGIEPATFGVTDQYSKPPSSIPKLAGWLFQVATIVLFIIKMCRLQTKSPCPPVQRQTAYLDGICALRVLLNSRPPEFVRGIIRPIPIVWFDYQIFR